MSGDYAGHRPLPATQSSVKYTCKWANAVWDMWEVLPTILLEKAIHRPCPLSAGHKTDPVLQIFISSCAAKQNVPDFSDQTEYNQPLPSDHGVSLWIKLLYKNLC
jgi:hypothetical protein